MPETARHSPFADVDSSPSPDRLIAYLDHAASGLAGMKRYVAVTLAMAVDGPVLDVGCGAGHDLLLLADHGRPAVGVDPSASMLAAAGARGAGPLVRAVGGHLPFAAGTFAGCRVERVLQHVEDPAAVIAEIVRVLRPGATVAVFEPDWRDARIGDHRFDGALSWLRTVRHPQIGGDVAPLLAGHGARIDDIVTERSFAYSLGAVEATIGLRAIVDRAVGQGRIDATRARSWLAAIARSDTAGRFSAEWSKVLTVARL